MNTNSGISSLQIFREGFFLKVYQKMEIIQLSMVVDSSIIKQKRTMQLKKKLM